MSELIEQLRAVVGAPHVITDGDLTNWEIDWRKRARGKALAVVRPASTAEVAAVVKACAAARTPIVPQGGNTGLVAGSVPDGTGTQVVLNLRRMNAIHTLDCANMTITAGAGCVLQALQQAAAERGLLFPLSLGSEGSCTIGGNLSTNAGGTQVLRYGNARELCLGLEVVTAQGEIWNGISGLRKDNTGYDLRQWFIGSEGTLGIITAATMKLFPKPAATVTAWLAVPSIGHAIELLSLCRQGLGSGVGGFELMGSTALQLVAKHFPQLRAPFVDESPFGVLLEYEDNAAQSDAQVHMEALLEAAMEGGLVTNAVVAASVQQARQLWHVRESIPLAQAQEGVNIRHDISIPISRIAAFCDETDRALAQLVPGARLVNYGHLGDGNLHYNVQAPADADASAFLREHEDQVSRAVYERVDRFAGSISAEHGIGSAKVDTLPHHKSAVALDMMRAVKRALDPACLLNPGRVVRVT